MATATVMRAPALGTASGVVAMLQEDDLTLKKFALSKLLSLIDEHWAEIVDSVPDIEELAEEGPAELRHVAAAVASKCYYHLEDYNQAVVLALGAGEHFDVESHSEYVDTIVSKCIDTYAEQRVQAATTSKEVQIDARLEDVVNRMFERCFRDHELTQAIGIALETRRIDMLRRAITVDPSQTAAMLQHCVQLAHTVVKRKEFRELVLEALVEIYEQSGSSAYLGLARCLEFLNKPRKVASVLVKLLQTGIDEEYLMALQLCFDVYEHDNQHFIAAVMNALPVKEGEDAVPVAADAEPVDAPAGASDSFWDNVATLRSILDGTLPAKIHIDFLARTTRADPLLLRNIKNAIEAKGGSMMEAKSKSVLHNAVVMTHGIMNCGTTMDGFWRDNLEWFGQAANWGLFSAVASIGTIHQGHTNEAMNVLQPYLPDPARVSQSAFMEGGGLYALGLIHANKGQLGGGEVITFLSEALRNTRAPEVQHGGALGIGLAAMATGTDALYGQLREIMFQDDAVAGEGAAIGIGLLLCGQGTSWQSAISDAAVSEMLNYSRDTAHEKIIRGIAMALAFIVFQQEEAADVMIDQMQRDKDPILRYGAAYAMGMAYCATSNNGIIRKLLHMAVSDVSDDVRRAAVTALGFVMCDDPGQVPRIVSLLAESYNPHVRYGAAIAIGVSCAATGMQAAVDILEPLAQDQSDFVRQGALLALGMVLQQEAVGRNPKVKTVRELFMSVIGDRVKPTMTKTGAILGAGIIDAGGRNCAISLRSSNGYTKMTSVVGMAMFLQHWYWTPYVPMLGLCMHPTSFIGLNKNLVMPKQFNATCQAKPSKFAYPDPVEDKKEEKKEKLVTVELSTAKRKQRTLNRQSSLNSARGDTPKASPRFSAGPSTNSAMEVDESAPAATSAGAPAGSDDTTAAAAATADKEPKASKPAPEPSSFVVHNPARVTLTQRSSIHLQPSDTTRYEPIVSDVSLLSGVLILRDNKPDEPEEIVEFKEPGAFGEVEEAPMPEPFEWEP